MNKKSIILAINTACSQTSIAILSDENKLIAEKTWESKNNEAEKLMPEIDAIITSAGHTFDDIKKVLVIKGPGSFTGLRVGVSVANTIAYLNKCELLAVDTFEYLWEARNSDDKAHTALLVFAGKGGVYLSKNRENATTAKMIDLPDLKAHLIENNIKNTFGDISDDQKEVINGFNFTEITDSFGKTAERILKKPLTDQKIVKPVYIKNPSITKSKKKLI